MQVRPGWIFCAAVVFCIHSTFAGTRANFQNIDEALRAFRKGSEEEILDLRARAVDYIQTKFTEALRSPVILKFRSSTLRQLLAMTWIVEEIEILQVLEKWFAENKDPSVRFRLRETLFADALNPSQLRNALNSKVLEKTEIIQALGRKVSKRILSLRFPNQLAFWNIIHERYLCEMISGYRLTETSPENFLGYAEIVSHNVDAEEGVTIKLGAGFTLDSIVLKLAETLHFNITVSVSIEGTEWQQVAARSGQKFAKGFEVLFRPTRVRFIRLFGNSRDKPSGPPRGVKIQTMEASYSRMYNESE